LLVLGLGVGLLSPVIPYTLELETLRRIPARFFGILLSLEPLWMPWSAWCSSARCCGGVSGRRSASSFSPASAPPPSRRPHPRRPKHRSPVISSALPEPPPRGGHRRGSYASRIASEAARLAAARRTASSWACRACSSHQARPASGR